MRNKNFPHFVNISKWHTSTKNKNTPDISHFTVHFYSFTAQSHVQSSYRVKVAFWNDIDAIF